MSEDREIVCADCGQSFTFTAQDQNFFAERGFTDPKRCKPCRDAKKARGPGGGGRGGPRGERSGGGGGDRGARPPRGDRPLFDATCAECGKKTQVPFEPRGDKPVYCSDCFRTIRERGGG